jgi:hypothetical protein
MQTARSGAPRRTPERAPSLGGDGMDGNAHIPELIVRVPFEGRPAVYLVATNESETNRLEAWLNGREDLNGLIESALEIEAAA